MSDDRDRTPAPRADVCVVGTGPGGALAGHSLAKRGYDVVFLEAGPRFEFRNRGEQMETAIRPEGSSLDVWNMGGARDAFTTGGEQNIRLNLNRVKGVGGTTLHWGGTVPRFHEKDFEMRSRYGLARDWPISYADLRPYYERAEREIGVAGVDDNPFAAPRRSSFPMKRFPKSYSDRIFEEACDRLDIAVHSVPRAQNSEVYDDRSHCVAFGTCSPVCPSGAKYSANVHVQKAEREGARVLSRTPVQRLEHDASGDRITAAVYATPDGETHRQEARQFVVACGAVETARLLLLSRSERYPDGLANSSGVVGCYFMSHPGVATVGRLDRPTGQNQIGFSTSMTHQFYENDGGTPGSIQIEFANTAEPALATAAVGTESFLQQVQDTLDSPSDLGYWSDVLFTPYDESAWGDELLTRLRRVYGNHVGMTSLVEQLPRKRNRVTLNPDVTDDHGNPVANVVNSPGDHVAAANRRSEEIQRSILKELGATEVGADVDFAPHQMGTTRMGTDPSESVVTPRLRTHDLDNLSIVSSSVFVTSAAVNPTLTIAALSLKAADHLAADL